MAEKLTIRRAEGMLPQLHPYTSKTDKPQGNTSLVPTITPPLHSISSNNTSCKLQYLLVPNPRNIVVRSMHHGRRVCVLVPENSVIRSLSIVWLPASDSNDDESDREQGATATSGEWVILAGCEDGSLQEWAISSLSLPHSKYCESISMDETSDDDGRKPRRIFQLECLLEEGKKSSKLMNLEVLHLASPESYDEQASQMLADARKGALLFSLVKGNTGKSDGEDAIWLTRCLVPSYRNITERGVGSINASPITCVQFVNTTTSKEDLFALQTRHVCLKEGDDIFGCLAAYRPNESAFGAGGFEIMGGSARNAGDVFVVLCSSYGLIVYHEKADTSLDDENEEFLSLVHFTGSTNQHIAHIPTDTHLFSSVAISPDAKDIVLGRSNGMINLLDDVFDSVMNYLVTFKKKMLEHEEDEVSAVIESLQHPHTSIVRRTVHWHSHPVVAVSFLAASGSRAFSSSMTKSLISGGEESVLATWQLDRNFHRPTHFLARISQGAIMHAACCHFSGMIIVSCADNSIHCHNATNYDELWVEQGLAAFPLHKEDEPTGPIISLKDPITNLLMLTNLPGAPGMIHWLDPTSNSVVGVLEAAPYNRVSRRDRTNDPHIPVPTVTHMGIGKNGKDLVTVDMVWTENLSVGSARNIIAPNKDIVHMNVSTSIKFWTYKGAGRNNQSDRKRKTRDNSMHYELVSSMASPHGRDGSVCGLDVAPKGNVACSLSKEENAFRIWVKNTTSEEEVLWKCLYKVRSPSGFSNMLSAKAALSSNERLVSFSSDGSVLSVCYGSIVTLWDHSSATLLTSVATNDNASGSQPKEDIREIYFMNKADDTLLITTKSQVCVKSPFGGGKCYLGNDEWSFNAGILGGGTCTVLAVVPLPGFGGISASGGFFATSVAAEGGKKSIVSIVNREKGELHCLNNEAKSPARWEVDGEVQTLCVISCSDSSLQLVAITKDCSMVSMSLGVEGHETLVPTSIPKRVVESQSRSAPLLKFTAEDKEPSTKRRKISIGLHKRVGKSDYSGLDFPALSGKFTRAFIIGQLHN